jgi:hypothetical protein
MIFTLQKVQCWSPGTSFNVFLEKSAPIDMATLSDSAQYVQVGPYKVKLEIVGKKGLAGLKIGARAQGLSDLANTGAVSGSVFVFLPEGVESTFDGIGALGSASGCFEVHW